MAVGLSVAATRVSVRLAVRIWKETKGFQLINRVLRKLRAFSVHFGVRMFLTREGEEAKSFPRKLENRRKWKGIVQY